MLFPTQAVATADDDVVISALDAVAEIAEGTSPMLAPYTNQLFTFMLQLLMNRDVDLPVTDCAGQVVINLITTRPKAMIKAGVVPQVMSTALQMAMNYDEEEHKEVHGSGTPSPTPGPSAGVSVSGVAERILDTVAIAVPSMCVARAWIHDTWDITAALLVLTLVLYLHTQTRAAATDGEGCASVEPHRVESTKGSTGGSGHGG